MMYQDANFKICLSLFSWKENILYKQHIVQRCGLNIKHVVLYEGTPVHAILNHKNSTGFAEGVREGQNMEDNILPSLISLFIFV